MEVALEGCYGSLKKGAKYNPATKKYEDPPSQDANVEDSTEARAGGKQEDDAATKQESEEKQQDTKRQRV